ncbi:DHA2 family efflux MFS transporter permease subunit [Corynebacterium sp. ES2730-CONJ]|nr:MULTISPECIES: DHA2 family efflux MFS transporter permease subunit [unclassified Corynebacterium]MCS4491846.1 DHA2 family efflux MFS transporter permease subunit [Corynebacterium sp. ES2715-CONJ3]MCS4531951.1 DHA2 family efflux MFS transporter permease subunit [Corynebacterium sp. ES2730-CONJ]
MTDISEKQAWRALAALCIGFFMILLDQTIVAVATPEIQAELGATLNQVVWVSSIYLLFFAVPILVTGRLGDRYGQRRMYITGMSIFTASSLACGLAPTIDILIVARAFQGIGAAIMTPQTMSVVNRIFPRDRRGAALGVWGAVAGLATLLGPILGGVLVSSVGWQWIFLANIPLGIPSIIAVYYWVPKLPRTAKAIDTVSVVVAIVAMSCFIFAVQQGPELGWPWWLWILLAIGLLGIGYFIRRQADVAARAEDALVPLEIFKDKNFSLAAFSISTMAFAVGGVMLPMMIYLQDGHQLSAQDAGFMLIPMSVLAGVLAPFVGRLSDRLHPRILSTIGFSCMLCAACALFVVMREGWSYWWLLLPVVLLGFGNGFVWSPNSATALRDLPVSQLGAASGVYNTTRQVGSVVGTAMIGALMQHGMAHSASVKDAMGFSMIAAVIALAFGLLAVIQFNDPSAKKNARVRENSQL